MNKLFLIGYCAYAAVNPLLAHDWVINLCLDVYQTSQFNSKYAFSISAIF